MAGKEQPAKIPHRDACRASSFGCDFDGDGSGGLFFSTLVGHLTNKAALTANDFILV